MTGASPAPLGWRITAHSFLAISIFLSAGYFFCSWAVHAERLGARDMSIALGSAFAAAFAAYGIIIFFPLACLTALLGSIFDKPTKALWAAAGVDAIALLAMMFR